MQDATTISDSPARNGKRWALVLAAGEGSRLGHLTRDHLGVPTPKQFCSMSGGPTLLEATLARGARLADPDAVVTVVAKQHRHWWHHDTSSLPCKNVVVQPLNRGTAAGILLPLLAIARRDPRAIVVVLPSDHFIARESAVQTAVESAFAAVEHDPANVVLLGITPDRPDSELGWILPEAGSEGGIGRVARFVEKPPTVIARRLQRHGGLWNSFIFVARADSLLALYRETLPELLSRLSSAVDQDAWRADVGAVKYAYKILESRDFSRDLLENSVDRLRVLPVGPCGWTDLGTPERLAFCTTGLKRGACAGDSTSPRRTFFGTAPRPVLAAAV